MVIHINVRKVVLDIETQNLFRDVGVNDPAALTISVVGIYDYQTDAYTTYLESELSKLWLILEKTDILIGFNSNHFDIPLLNKYYPGDLTKIKSIDLLHEIKSASGKRIGLGYIAKATLNRGKIGHGLEAITWWKNGEVERVRKYCLEDVKLTKELYEYARQHGVLKYPDGSQIFDIKIDASKWEDKIESAMTYTLPF
ncbi:MAG TPA: ribonuclease H-like domain-containing protein [Candidatus Paceibacterota bacterium]